MDLGNFGGWYMFAKIKTLKKAILNLEKDLTLCEKQQFYNDMAYIRNLLGELEDEFNVSIEAFETIFKTTDLEIEVDDSYSKQLELKDFDIGLEVEEFIPDTIDEDFVYELGKSRVLNELEFLYKPINKASIYEGNYLERFSDERTSQLMKSRSINQHNEFWKMNQIVKGNVYGSVPSELLNNDSIETLRRFGWKDVWVKIHDFGAIKVSMDVFISELERKFDDYILLYEEETETHLVLEYQI